MPPHWTPIIRPNHSPEAAGRHARTLLERAFKGSEILESDLKHNIDDQVIPKYMHFHCLSYTCMCSPISGIDTCLFMKVSGKILHFYPGDLSCLSQRDDFGRVLLDVLVDLL
jgi:hypothetical protein